MKKFFIDMIYKVIYYALFAALAFGSVTSQSNILNIVAAAFCVVILLGCVIGVFTTFLAYAVEKVTDEKSRQSALESLRKIVRRKNVIARWWGWLCMVAIIY